MKLNDTFGQLTVIAFDGNKATCRCDCGNIKSIRKTSLTRNKQPTQSCGCIQRKIAHNTGKSTILKNSSRQIKQNLTFNTNFQVITQDKPPRNNSSGVKGVSWNKSKNAWQAYIGLHGNRIHLGRYNNFDDAVKARKNAEEKYYDPLIEQLKNK